MSVQCLLRYRLRCPHRPLCPSAPLRLRQVCPVHALALMLDRAACALRLVMLAWP